MMATLSVATVLGVALGGALGAVLRLLLDRYLRGGVLLANTLGCFILGFLFGEFSVLQTDDATVDVGWLSEPVLAVLAVGLVGALSTFSTVSLRVAQLWMDGRRPRAVFTWTSHVLCGITGGVLGVAVSGMPALG